MNRLYSYPMTPSTVLVLPSLLPTPTEHENLLTDWKLAWLVPILPPKSRLKSRSAESNDPVTVANSAQSAWTNSSTSACSPSRNKHLQVTGMQESVHLLAPAFLLGAACTMVCWCSRLPLYRTPGTNGVGPYAVKPMRWKNRMAPGF